ncbi:uncharacterized protein BDZ99DRAFT_533624 [Mytilinidion resinicola]|uniref:RING-type domain-containing protein n=1 Tax=Mytilinidion resinicola TaxID=574789 RepID=A0A6A6YJX8_9PEZI|nr:uncharacterized protein BDZ99DRAFT_533624 [Mytilinidion resinicola]KAF2809111.1 hypothetical protein BDZ99DRAFT_533624 [Mytilinidion resinicola]
MSLDEVVTRCDVPEDEPTCAICKEESNDEHRAIQTACFHVFGEECLSNWVQRFPRHQASCPMCLRILELPIENRTGFFMTPKARRELIRENKERQFRERAAAVETTPRSAIPKVVGAAIPAALADAQQLQENMRNNMSRFETFLEDGVEEVSLADLEALEESYSTEDGDDQAELA